MPAKKVIMDELRLQLRIISGGYKSARTSTRTCITVGAVDVDSTAWVMLAYERHLLIFEWLTIIFEEDHG